MFRDVRNAALFFSMLFIALVLSLSLTSVAAAQENHVFQGRDLP